MSNPFVLKIVEKILAKFFKISREEKIFENQTDLEGLIPSVLERVRSGHVFPVSSVPTLVDALLESVAVMIAVEPEFEEHKQALLAKFPMTPQSVRHLSHQEIERQISRISPMARGEKTVILGVGRDHQTVQNSLRRGADVVAVDRNERSLSSLKDRITGHPEYLLQGSRLTWEKTSFSDPEFMLRHSNSVDRIYLLHTNDLSCAATVANLLKPGGVLITQDRGDISPQFTRLLNLPRVREPEFTVVQQYRNMAPVFDTPWSKINPSGNVINIIQRNPQSPVAGKVFLTVPPRVRRIIERESQQGFVPLRWVRDFEVNGCRAPDQSSSF